MSQPFVEQGLSKESNVANAVDAMTAAPSLLTMLAKVTIVILFGTPCFSNLDGEAARAFAIFFPCIFRTLSIIVLSPLSLATVPT